MLREFPGVHRWEQTDDVLQNALVRLCRALRAVTPPTPRDLFRLAAMQIRRELLDMARRYSGPQGLKANHASQQADLREDGAFEAADSTYDPVRLIEWTQFHHEVDRLPDEDREVFDLLYYQGLSQADAAVLLGVSDRTIKRRWQSARLALHEALGGRIPGS
jgi:RNA polymerase sigma-70 factor (ECF subfamily)